MPCEIEASKETCACMGAPTITWHYAMNSMERCQFCETAVRADKVDDPKYGFGMTPCAHARADLAEPSRAPQLMELTPANAFMPTREWPDPTPQMLNDPRFEAVWQCIKSWDINVPEAYGGYCRATGNHVRAILDALATVS